MNTNEYWRSLVQAGDRQALEEVGHPDMGRSWNSWSYRLRWEAVSRLTGADAGALAGARVFEAAYGVGFYLGHWQRAGVTHVTGMDISPAAAAAGRARFPGYDLRTGDLAELANEPDYEALQGRFDLVTAIDVLYHLVDDDAAERAVVALGRLVRSGGTLLLTDKGHGLRAPVRESGIVTRRPISWYSERLRPLGFRTTRVAPVFWSMDPPLAHAGASPAYRTARTTWVGMRALIKFLPHNSLAQRAVGHMVGSIGYLVDRAVLGAAAATVNLEIATLERA